MEIYTLYTLASGVLLKLFNILPTGTTKETIKLPRREYMLSVKNIWFRKIKYFKCRNKLKYFSIRSYLSGYGTYLAISGCFDLGRLALNEMKWGPVKIRHSDFQAINCVGTLDRTVFKFTSFSKYLYTGSINIKSFSIR